MHDNYPDRTWEILACPHCSRSLVRNQDGYATCETCRIIFPYSSHGALDLRLVRPKNLTLELSIPISQDPTYNASTQPLVMNPTPEIDLSHIKIPHHLTKQIISYFPRPKTTQSRVIDIGCGDVIHKDICEAAGFEYIGIDISNENAPILADAQALPFLDESYDFLLCMNVLEHIRLPFVAMREAYRVLKPGGRMIGTMSFLEPFHDNSYYHHSPLGAWTTLTYVPLEIMKVCPSSEGWSALYAIACMALYPRMPRIISKAIVAPAQFFHRFWYWIGSIVFPKTSQALRMQKISGDFTFITEKSRD